MSSLKRSYHPSTIVANDLPQQQQQQHKIKNRRLAVPPSPSNTTGQNETATITCRRIIVESRKKNKSSLYECESTILEELLYPYKVNDFLKESFRQHAVHVQWPRNKASTSTTTTTATTATTTTTTKQSNTFISHHEQRFPNIPLLQSIIDEPDIASLVRETSSESIFVWLAKPSSSSSQNTTPSLSQTNTSSSSLSSLPLIQSIEISDPETAIKLHDISGHALYFRASPHIEQTFVSSILKSIGLGGGGCRNTTITTTTTTSLGRGEVEIFVGGHSYPREIRRNNNNNNNIKPEPTTNTSIPNSPNMNHRSNFVTGWHYDFQENFTIQISGIKRWTLYPGMVQHPLRACTPHYDIVVDGSNPNPNHDSVMESQVLASRLANPMVLSPTSMISTNTDNHTTTSSSKLEVVDMYPGDVLYFPAGMWHTVETIESGISMNISLMASNYATIACQALQHYLLRHDEWRQCIVHNHNGSAVEHLQQLIQSLPTLLQKIVDNNEWNARMILPPVLYEPISMNSEHHDNDDDDDDENDNEDNDDEDNENDVVIKIGDIILPDIRLDGMNVFQQWPIDTHRLCQNPLAILLHEDKEIRNCFANFQPLQSDHHYFPTPTNATCGDTTISSSSSIDSIYVLNVNFAGNEGHESMIRYRLLLNDVAVQTIQRHIQNPTTVVLMDDDTDFPHVTEHHVNCLVYYGYLTWEKK